MSTIWPDRLLATIVAVEVPAEVAVPGTLSATVTLTVSFPALA